MIVKPADVSPESERRYWNENFGAPSSANDILFDWMNDLRLRLFRPDAGGLSLEVGPGSGQFAKKAGIDVGFDISHTALMSLKSKSDCMLVVGSADAMPFRDGCFGSIYANDVLHHLKGEGVLGPSCREIKRTLAEGGLFYVSDRTPCLYNTVTLWLNAYARSLLIRLQKSMGKKFQLSGSDYEPVMTTEDYTLIKTNMVVVADRRWRSWLIFWGYGFLQFAILLLPERTAGAVARIVKAFLVGGENLLGDFFKCDCCLTLRRRSLDDG